jgi:hypothetical protein
MFVEVEKNFNLDSLELLQVGISSADGKILSCLGIDIVETTALF